MRVRSRLFLACGALCLLASSASATPTHLWSHRYGDYMAQVVNSCAADPSGNVVICGSFLGSINITTPFAGSTDYNDAIVAKFDPAGNALWSVRIGTQNGSDTGRAAACDNAGNVVVAGSVRPQGGAHKPFVARYSPTGVQQWITYFSSSSPDSQCAIEGVDTGPDNHILVAGRFHGDINLGGATLVAESENDLFVAEFDEAGGHVWSKSFAATSEPDTVLYGFGNRCGIAVDPSGQPVVFGTFEGSVDFGGGPLAIPDNNSNFFLAKFDHNGGHLWSERFVGPQGARFARDIDVDPNGRIAITGSIYSGTDFGGGVLTPAGQQDIVLAVFNPDGSHSWSKRFGSVSREDGFSVAFAANSDVLLSAYAKYIGGTLTFGGDSMTPRGIFMARFHVADGAHIWSVRFNEESSRPTSDICEANGDVFLGGSVLSDVDFGGGVLDGVGLYEDMFVVRFSDQPTAVSPTLARASLQQNVPNPFNPLTRIAYSLTLPAHVVIEIFDANGGLVARLNQGPRPAGTHSLIWNGREANGNALASGVYFYRLAGAPDAGARKMVLLK